MTCPKCGGQMKTFDRAGIHVEQCAQCRGIFLDYGELEQIVTADQSYQAPPPLPGGPSVHGQRSRPDSPAPFSGYERESGRRYPDSPRPYGRKKRGSIFEQLFD